MINHFANPVEILSSNSQQSWSGCIEIVEPKDNSISWQIYLYQGKIQYITSTIGNQERLNYIWQKLNLGLLCPQVSATKEYEQICEWYKSEQATDYTLEDLIFKLNQEGINYLLSIKKAKIKFSNKHLPKKSPSFLLKDLVDPKIVNSWKKIGKYINSPLMRVYTPKEKHFGFYKLWVKQKLVQDSDFYKFANSHNVSQICKYCSQKLVFYKLALILELDVLFLAEFLQEFFESKIIQLEPFAKSSSANPTNANENTKDSFFKNNLSTKDQNDSRPVIACIDDSKAVHKQVNLTLEAVGYKVINVNNPQLALRILYHAKPALILMDISMPSISGYELCKMLRGSNKYDEIPIVMLTGRDGIIDRVRAKMVGSTDYLTKPCQPDALIEMVQKYVTPVTST